MQGDQCPFSHTLCQNWEKGGSCPHGDYCSSVHRVRQSMPSPQSNPSSPSRPPISSPDGAASAPSPPPSSSPSTSSSSKSKCVEFEQGLCRDYPCPRGIAPLPTIAIIRQFILYWFLAFKYSFPPKVSHSAIIDLAFFLLFMSLPSSSPIDLLLLIFIIIESYWHFQNL